LASNRPCCTTEPKETAAQERKRQRDNQSAAARDAIRDGRRHAYHTRTSALSHTANPPHYTPLRAPLPLQTPAASNAPAPRPDDDDDDDDIRTPSPRRQQPAVVTATATAAPPLSFLSQYPKVESYVPSRAARPRNSLRRSLLRDASIPIYS
jgi:hypothetical protein